ncbi:hypothetical protein SanaruYs_03270 [Chryseotalea sanaruensis]|uniref:Uncharacterized protein n=1 Tax=Chryseotalea sanaruensis TaxID=2482724 RepID=A0A401U5F5_9BACT|nr:hypothetical protein [Chryseotalea sanaruensis]GCC50112.1 hypothetical protein SanaruYs_03270 [Chryseotalea sanaruensis]
MGLFSLFRRKPEESDERSDTISNSIVEEKVVGEYKQPDSEQVLPEIREEVFIEYEKPRKSTMNNSETGSEVNNLQTLYKFLEKSYEKEGYEDALVNPDTSYLKQNILKIQNELSLNIAKVKTYYSSHLRQINFHIETRKRNGMIEIVEELVTHRETIEEEINTVAIIESDAKNNEGLCSNLFLSYTRGFNNGFAAITYNKILGLSNDSE